ncbi:hypothetical protein PoB_004436400 [Plakobranchus ocellatus]|uniref:Uncharacterized protein n=1 Tax=Plakobranchus ocellatus TaxID=259542 RepID=A0AAV4BG72_9GAST|nr:hypothetical protein PoB_004436400 [Plakobranchus ocellatus]
MTLKPKDSMWAELVTVFVQQASPQRGDLMLSGLRQARDSMWLERLGSTTKMVSGFWALCHAKGAGGGARTRDKRVSVDFMANSLSSVPPTTLQV